MHNNNSLRELNVNAATTVKPVHLAWQYWPSQYDILCIGTVERFKTNAMIKKFESNLRICSHQRKWKIFHLSGKKWHTQDENIWTGGFVEIQIARSVRKRLMNLSSKLYGFFLCLFWGKDPRISIAMHTVYRKSNYQSLCLHVSGDGK